LGGPAPGGCAGGWLLPSGPARATAITLAVASVAVGGGAVASTGSGGDEVGGSQGGGHPMPPSPSPAPGGASGGAAGGVGGGAGMPGFLAFAVLLALATPRAMRRLRLACLPWRTAFFVLIPERPG
jgi:hypothetical protein